VTAQEQGLGVEVLVIALVVGFVSLPYEGVGEEAVDCFQVYQG
jgi:hypothetical protein